MADKKQETIADVVAWLRRPREGENAYLTLWRDEIADRIEAAHKRELSKNVSKNGADFGQLGGAAKLREALVNIAGYARSAQCHTEDAHVLGYLNQIEGWAKAALAAPARNCDVGTADEQSQRFDAFCDANKYVGDDGANWCSPKCPCSNSINCGVVWAQMPYEEGVADGAAT